VNQCFSLARFWNRDFFDWQRRRGSELSKNAALSFRWYSWLAIPVFLNKAAGKSKLYFAVRAIVPF